jgi:hypothetical protein
MSLALVSCFGLVVGLDVVSGFSDLVLTVGTTSACVVGSGRVVGAAVVIGAVWRAWVPI